jgi:hypothetical protein
MEKNFTDEELSIAKGVDLTDVAARFGYTVTRIGRCHTLKEMDSIRIYNRTSWFRWSNCTGGSQIDFLCKLQGMEVKEAVFWLLDFAGYSPSSPAPDKKALRHQAASKPKDKPTFALPDPAPDNQRLYAYLGGKRGIGTAVIDRFVNCGLIYESDVFHNVVFVGRDAGGAARFAHIRGTGSQPFKRDVAGSDKNYGFNITNNGNASLLVFESAIDLMSHLEIIGEGEANRLALGMLGDAPIGTFLREHPQIERIALCLDSDPPGRKAAARMADKYQSLGYHVTVNLPETGYKDYNAWLAAMKTPPSIGGR